MIFIEKEKYKLNEGKQELPGFDDKYLNIVHYILEITEDIWEKRGVWIIYDTYADDVVVHQGAQVTSGIDSVIKGTLKTLSTFPDRKMGAEEVIWSKEQTGCFYSSHRIASVATNTGASVFGPATGKKVFFRTIADCIVFENKIIEEWLVRDNLHLIKQLGFDPVEMAKRDKRYDSFPPITAVRSLIGQGEIPQGIAIDHPVRKVVDLFEKVFGTQSGQQNLDILETYYHPGAITHMICEQDLSSNDERAKYFKSFFDSLPLVRVYLARLSCIPSDAQAEFKLAARWAITARNPIDPMCSLSIPVITHYLFKGGKIAEEWLVFDAFDLLCQMYAKPQVLCPQKNQEDSRKPVEILKFLQVNNSAEIR